MKNTTALTTATAIDATVLVICALAWARMATWGATPQEARAALPGDELLESVKYRTTRAVTINASDEDVWPWLAQMGQGRGGLYSYDRIENLVGLKMHSADRVIPELQALEVGDVIRMVPEDMEPALCFSVVRADPPHVLVLGPHGSREEAFAAGLPHPVWTFRLIPNGERRCRLVVRFQSDFANTAKGWITNDYALRPLHFVMEHKMLRGIRQRAEREARAAVA